jgi:hypothetical protein
LQGVFGKQWEKEGWNIGGLEYWSNGMIKDWKDGMMEGWRQEGGDDLKRVDRIGEFL